MSRLPRVHRLTDRWNAWFASHPLLELALLALVPAVVYGGMTYLFGDDLVGGALRGAVFGVTYAVFTVAVRRFRSDD